jgi:alpha-galactosidase
VGCEIFVIDAGWYADASGWWGTIGAYEESKERFPGGFKKVFDHIREKGMRPGLWVEPEDIGIASEKISEFDDDAFFVRHGKRVIERGRHQFDMRNEKVRAHLTAIIDRLIKDYGIEYFKFDYNIDAGVGTERNADSFGDGLYESGLAAIKWIDELQEKYPDLIIENCSSGGMRADYMQLQHYSVQSTTDVWENKHMVQLAAAAPTGVLPEQACVWCLPRTEFSHKEIASTLVNAMFRRIHLSGKTAFLKDDQKALLHEGIRVYKETRGLVDKLIPFYPLGIPSASSDATLHCVGFKNDKNCFITVTNMGEKGEFTIPLSFTPDKVEIVYPTTIPCEAYATENGVKVTLENTQAVAIKLK